MCNRPLLPPCGSESRGPAADGGGFDTLEEEEEKSKFFAKLQAEVSSPLDFSKLLGALDSTASTTGETLGCVEAAARRRSEVETQRLDQQEPEQLLQMLLYSVSAASLMEGTADQVDKGCKPQRMAGDGPGPALTSTSVPFVDKPFLL